MRYVDPPNLDGVRVGGDADTLRASHSKTARRAHAEAKRREDAYSYTNPDKTVLFVVADGIRTRTARCAPCERWYELSRPATQNQRWPKFCSEPCRKQHDRDRKRRQRSGERKYLHTSFDPSKWLDPEYIAKSITGQRFEPDMYDDRSDAAASKLGTQLRRDSSPEARTQAQAFLDSLVDDYDRCQRSMPIPVDVHGECAVYTTEHRPGTFIPEPVEGEGSDVPLYADGTLPTNTDPDPDAKPKPVDEESQSTYNRQLRQQAETYFAEQAAERAAIWARHGSGWTGHGRPA